jgi:ubiquinone/menaquinone biosynthesis C-methylase UbiE
MLKKAFWHWASSIYDQTFRLNYGRDIIVDWVREFVKASLPVNKELNILDIGLGEGTDLANVKRKISNKISAFGVECYPPNIETANKNGIKVYPINIETDVIPAENNYFDVVIANQIIEHSKEIFWIFSEISRVLKKQGLLIVGVPNLASLHNRILFLGGLQPTCLELLGSHVRGITAPAFKRFVEAGGYFKIKGIKGSNFYPFPPIISRILSRLLPTFSVSLFFEIERTAKEGKFIEVLNSKFYETPYFKGDNYGRSDERKKSQ